jgi:hypothetical protein
MFYFVLTYKLHNICNKFLNKQVVEKFREIRVRRTIFECFDRKFCAQFYDNRFSV